jgi:hypothetical protein
MVNASLISRLSHAVDLIERRSRHNRPWKVVTVRRGGMRREIATLRPIPRIGANIVIFEFYDDEDVIFEFDDEEMANNS